MVRIIFYEYIDLKASKNSKEYSPALTRILRMSTNCTMCYWEIETRRYLIHYVSNHSKLDAGKENV